MLRRNLNEDTVFINSLYLLNNNYNKKSFTQVVNRSTTYHEFEISNYFVSKYKITNITTTLTSKNLIESSYNNLLYFILVSIKVV